MDGRFLVRVAASLIPPFQIAPSLQLRTPFPPFQFGNANRVPSQPSFDRYLRNPLGVFDRDLVQRYRSDPPPSRVGCDGVASSHHRAMGLFDRARAPKQEESDASYGAGEQLNASEAGGARGGTQQTRREVVDVGRSVAGTCLHKPRTALRDGKKPSVRVRGKESDRSMNVHSQIPPECTIHTKDWRRLGLTLEPCTKCTGYQLLQSTFSRNESTM